MQRKRFRGPDTGLLLQKPGCLPFKCPAHEGERKDKKLLLPTPLNILDKNNDCVNLTPTSQNLFLPSFWPRVKKRLEHTIFQERMCPWFIAYMAVTGRSVWNVSQTRSKHWSPLPKRKRRFPVADNGSGKHALVAPSLPLPRRTEGSGFWLRGIPSAGNQS